MTDKHAPKKSKSCTPEQAEKDRERIQKLVELVPRDLCVELVTRYHDKIEEDIADKVILEGFDDPEEFERIATGECPEDCSTDEKELHRTFASFFKGFVGKTFGDLDSDITPEEKAKEVEGEVITLRNELVRSWINIFWLMRRREKSTEKFRILLDAQFLPIIGVKEIVGDNARFSECRTWREFLELSLMNCVAVDKKDISVVFDAFAKNIADNPDSYLELELTDGLTIFENFSGYYLRQLSE